MEPIEVSAAADPKEGATASAAAAAAGDKGGEKPSKELTEARAEITRLSKSNTELSASERYWAEKAAEKSERREPKAAPAAEDDSYLDDPAAFIEALSTKGSKAIAALLKREGLVTKAQAEEIAEKSSRGAVAAAKKSIQQDTRLLSSHPELNDESTPMYKLTGEIYRQMVADDPAMKDSPAALNLAARTAKAEIKGREKAAPAEDDEETKRLARIRAQSGDRGRRSSAAFQDDDDAAALPSETAKLLKSMGVDEKSWRAEKKRIKEQGA